MIALRTLLISLLVDTELPKERFHITHVLTEVIARLVHAIVGHGTNLADDR